MWCLFKEVATDQLAIIYVLKAALPYVSNKQTKATPT
jgi:hypothetical protein